MDRRAEPRSTSRSNIWLATNWLAKPGIRQSACFISRGATIVVGAVAGSEHSAHGLGTIQFFWFDSCSTRVGVWHPLVSACAEEGQKISDPHNRTFRFASVWPIS